MNIALGEAGLVLSLLGAVAGALVLATGAWGCAGVRRRRCQTSMPRRNPIVAAWTTSLKGEEVPEGQAATEPAPALPSSVASRGKMAGEQQQQLLKAAVLRVATSPALPGSRRPGNCQALVM